ncbi:related to glutamyl-tRNA(Gln) amidotransferase, subunit A [Phialocephala subalpina]|uniref:Related to glutamyl-tRNA(Gln) amidotransferase, subunit A n=1 Tax=Phialocephala subalpina TaxID=576137 RepID=A0A1L7XHN7_9HELO|nr:related to glutamyl-tRNA(Gln) amidotransferase, subunit A [Phialocephala subalpina]
MRLHAPLGWFPTAFGLVLHAALATADLIDNGKVVTLGDITYYAGGIPVSTLHGVNGQIVTGLLDIGADLLPLTVIHTNSSHFSTVELNSIVSTFLDSDDVFHTEFLESVYLAYDGSKTPSVDTQSCAPTLDGYGTELFMVGPTFKTSMFSGVTKVSFSKELPSGPYFMSPSTGDIFRAYRLYPDDYLAFISGAVSDEDDGFLALPAVTENVMAKSIAVPSRLYYTASADKPLAGLRLGVKDIYHVKGIKTSGGNRAYYYFYGTQNATAPSIQGIIDQGAVSVGKMGTVQFANGDSPTADWVDLHCPFNPRGDGYQSPSGSSSGPGAGMGAYSWLDIAVGSDTGGSMRGPSGSQGLYGNRPSTGAISMDHVIPLSPELDTAGVFARSASLWSTAIQAWYQNFSSNYTTYPKSIYYSGAAAGWSDVSETTPEAYALLDTFISQLETFLSVNRTNVNLTQHWIDTHAPEAPSDVNEMLNTTYAILTSVDQYALLGAPFFSDYAAANQGRTPFINPGPLARWRWGQANSDNSTYAAALANMTTFRTWWSTTGFGRPDPDSCSEGLYVYPWSTGTTDYRNRYFLATNHPPLGFSDWAVAGYAGAGEVIVPLGEAPYNSTVTGKVEYLPVTMAIQAARGCDFVLARLVSELEEKGILRPVGTGSRLYSN